MEDSSPATPPAESVWPRRLLVAAIAVVVGLCIGVAAGALHASGMSLVVVQSLAAGVLVGVVLIGAATSGGVGKPRWPAALLAAVIAIATEHYWLYTAAMDARQAATAKQPAVELFRPGWSDESFWEFMQGEATTQAIALWTLDACLLALAAVVIVEWSARKRPPNIDA